MNTINDTGRGASTNIHMNLLYHRPFTTPHRVPLLRFCRRQRSTAPRAHRPRRRHTPARAMFALSSKITFAKTVVADASARRAGKRTTHVVKVRRANECMNG
jgi:hypothetical protein